MIIKVTYNKSTNEIIIDSDTMIAELNSNSVVDNSEQVSFEIAVNTAQYEREQNNFEEDLIEDIS
jgi:response regulator of citrate/malate metabolism